MTIFVGSRYEYEPVDRVPTPRGQYQAAVFRTPGPVLDDFTFVLHTWTEGDRLDLIAAAAYGDSEMWWLIAEANPEFFDFDDLEPGTALRIPRGSALR